MISDSLLLLLLISVTFAFKLPSSGTATVTHYLLGDNVGACDCATGANKFPVAAINQNAFGQVNGTAGPGCGRCFNIILNTAISDQNYTITDASNRPEITVKIVDLCPGLAPNLEWCAQTDSTPNPHGAWVHFDLSQTTIPSNWFPQPFGYDIGQWLATYSEVSCTEWAGYKQPQTSGLAVAGAGCCPANPTYDNQTCPMSGSSGTTASSSSRVYFDRALGTLIFIALLSVIYLN
ncbi:hypothetical protein K450DRAFT_239914 [Umbelopsis ramanniana AG]|uniref:Expansin-like EG45 domain-containing protein n=1 Tax=Umbelopsis ramanniana AG TaxID=1314678 RepID=A0AAD5HD62_UMBRA|nr:uncharacterized protein K450DRAFT_239914 [Umbelopsis ramanniana AG]KAI8579960.1 hypothetical protein K450DRAFT_239914 [Umbelopsis ramanniana AG]